jgi:hypothetical protein
LAHRVAQEALKGTQIRTLTKRYNLRSWDVRFALETPRLTTAETGPLTGPVTGELADLVESVISRELNGRQIWTELMDHHDYLVTYDSIRHYIRYTRSRTAKAQTLHSSPEPSNSLRDPPPHADADYEVRTLSPAARGKCQKPGGPRWSAAVLIEAVHRCFSGSLQQAPATALCCVPLAEPPTESHVGGSRDER